MVEVNDKQKTKEELIEELQRLRHRVAELQESENQRRREDKTVQESEERLRTLLDSIPTGIVVIDAEAHVIVDANPSAVEMLGVPPEQVIGSVCHNYICPAERGRCPITDLGQTVDKSERVLLAHGKSVPILKTVASITLDGRRHLLESFVDITERKRMEETLRESEEKYRTILENIEDGYYEVDLAGNLTFFNNTLCRILGYTKDEVMGMNYRQYMDDDVAEEVFQTFNEVYRTGKPTKASDWEIIRKDGTRRFNEASISLIRDPTGEPAGFRGIVRDITGHRQAETERAQLLAALERRSTYLQTAAEAARTASSILDPGELMSQVVELLCERFDLYYAGLFLVDQTGEWTNEPGRWAVLQAGTGEAGRQLLEQGHRLEIGGTSMIGWCVANRQARIALDVGDEAVRFENPLLPETRSELALPLVSRGQAIGALTIQSSQEAAFSDEDIMVLQTMGDQLANAIANTRLYDQAQQEIAERKRAEDAMHQAEQRYRAVAESAVTGIGIVDREETLTFVNQAFADMLGYSQEELTGMGLSQLADPEEFAGFQERTKEREEKGVHSHYEAALRRKDGSALNILVSASPLTTSDGKFEGTLAVIIDITERKRTEEALQEAHRDLEQYAASLERQTTQLQVASEVARDAAAIREVTQLLDETVHLVSDRFGFCHTGIFLVDEQNRYAVLRAASSEGGRQMLKQGYRVQVSEDGIVGYAAATGEPRIALDVGADAVLFDDLDLPDTRSQAVLPLNLRGRTIGVLDVQSTEEAAFSQDSLVALQTLADQLAIAIENARLAERTEAQLRELSLLYGEYSAAAWARLASPQHVSSYVYDRVDVSPAGRLSVPALDSAIAEGETITIAEPEMTETMLATPLKVRDQIIGALGIQGTDGVREWSPDEVALVEAVSEQVAMALENARLFAETQRSAQTMQALYETSRALSSTLEEESLMRAILEAVYHTLGCEHVIISTVDRKTKTIGIRHGIWSGEFDAFPDWIQAAQYPLDHPDILADIYRTGRTETIGEWDARFNREIWEEFGHERLLRIFMPIKMRDRVIGVVEAGYDKREKGQIADEEVQMLAAFMDQAAVALENAHLLEETQRKATQLAASAEVARDATAILDVEHLLDQTVHLISEQFGFYHAGVFLIDEHDEYAVLQAASSEGGRHMLERGHRLRVGEVGIVGHVAGTGEPRIALDVGEDATHFANPDLPNTRSEMALPLLVQERVVGVLDVQSTEEAVFSEDDLAVLQTMADQLATAIANARLFEQVQRRARREQLIREITARIRSTVDVESILQTTVRELGKALGASHGLVRLGTEAELAEPPRKGQAGPGAAKSMEHATDG